MRSSIRLCMVLLVAVSVLLPAVLAVEKLQIVTPTDFSAAVGTTLLKEVPALFGSPPYRSLLVGRAFYAYPPNGCSPLNTSDPIWQDPSAYIFAVLDRGGCTFVTKVRNAQNAGARAALIADNINEPYMPLMADDGTGSNVQIPSVLVDYTQANAMKNWLINHPGPNTMSLTYNLPNPDNRVEWDMFTSSWDVQSVAFKAAMVPVVKALDSLQFFTPHYYIINGVPLGCTQPGQPCGNQCLNGGKYCALDPDRNLGQGLSGQDVVYEDVRQLCIWSWLNQTYGEGRNQYLFFQYIAAQNNVCYNVSNPDKWRDGVCQNQQLRNLGLPQSVVDQINQCMVQSNNTDGTNSLLARMISDQEKFGINYLPAVFVNLTPYRGALCTAPILNSGCSVVDMICKGFDDNAIPSVCQASKDCAFGVSLDCSSTCGTKVVDGCGVCLDPTDTMANKSCVDRNGVFCPPPQTIDACRDCNGDGSKCASSSALSTGAIVGIVFAALFVVALVGGGVYFYMQYQSKKMREDIDSLLKQYLPLEGGINSGGTGAQQKNGRLVDTASEHDL